MKARLSKKGDYVHHVSSSFLKLWINQKGSKPMKIFTSLKYFKKTRYILNWGMIMSLQTIQHNHCSVFPKTKDLFSTIRQNQVILWMTRSICCWNLSLKLILQIVMIKRMTTMSVKSDHTEDMLNLMHLI